MAAKCSRSGNPDGPEARNRLLTSSKVKSVLLAVKTGVVRSVGEGDFVPEDAAVAVEPTA
ncbi:hypothetical protein GCM10027068_39640 [Prescottella soli]